MSEHQLAHASIRFFGPSLDPLEVTMMLRLPYDHTHRDGEPRLTRRDGIVREYSPFRGGMWNMSSEAWVKSAVLDHHVCWLLDQLEERREAVLRLLRRDIRADIFCYSCGPTRDPLDLPPVTRARADAFGIEIVIDHYDSSSDDEEAI